MRRGAISTIRRLSPSLAHAPSQRLCRSGYVGKSTPIVAIASSVIGQTCGRLPEGRRAMNGSGSSCVKAELIKVARCQQSTAKDVEDAAVRLEGMGLLGAEITETGCSEDELVTLFKGLARHSRWKRALAVCEAVKTRANDKMFAAVINACNRGSAWEAAICIFTERRRGQDFGSRSLSAHMETCARRGFWEDALDSLTALNSATEGLNTFRVNVAMNACSRGNQWRWALHLLDRGMGDVGVQPDAYSFGMATDACAKAALWQVAISVLASAEKRGVTPDDAGCGALIVALGQGQQWSRVLSQFSEWRSKSCVDPHGRSVSRLASFGIKIWGAGVVAVSQAGQWMHALHLMEEMEDLTIEPDRACWNAVLAAYHRDVGNPT
eukprot:TRINITY_DN30930_c0_g1_i1.p1 TRINITY_DN30930_c0_g1~~TRINITY_DN30930_c0_g1_i1.p1  ORF type:complete len:381 (+),score=42.89 TRINITY_DN30930_c0_g1_i1:114-1256(+)